MITAKINVTKIDRAKLFKGEKGTYLDIVLIDTPNGQYGDYMVVQSVTKEEREAGVRGTILGNGKTVVRKGAQSAPAQPQSAPPAARPAASDDEDIPF